MGFGNLWPWALKLLFQRQTQTRRTLQHVGTLGRGLGSEGCARAVLDAGLEACAPVYSVLLVDMTALPPGLLRVHCIAEVWRCRRRQFNWCI